MWLPFYITKYTTSAISTKIFDTLLSQNIKTISYDDGIPLIHRTIANMYICSMATVRNILEDFMTNEVKCNRLTKLQMNYYMRILGYTCPACISNTQNHTLPGGCKWEDNEDHDMLGGC